MAAHWPVLLRESLQRMELQPGLRVLDGTAGAGGHSEAMVRAIGPQGSLVGLDRDPAALALAKPRLQAAAAAAGTKVELVRTSFAEYLVAEPEPDQRFDRMFFDLGVSSMQLDEPERGFSFRRDGPLDMRMGGTTEVGTPSAADLVNRLSETELASIFDKFGEERFARKIAQVLTLRRTERLFERTGDLQAAVAGAIPRKAWPKEIDPATRVFQALRIAVNGELQQLETLLERFPAWLKPGGCIGIISFQSLEDRLIKQRFRLLANPCQCPPTLPRCICGKQPLGQVATGKPIIADEVEVAANPRSRSAKLRIFTILQAPDS